MVESPYRSSKKSKGDKKRGSSSTEDIFSLEFSMALSMGHEPKRFKSAKASKLSKNEAGSSYEENKTSGRASRGKSHRPGEGRLHYCSGTCIHQTFSWFPLDLLQSRPQYSQVLWLDDSNTTRTIPRGWINVSVAADNAGGLTVTSPPSAGPVVETEMEESSGGKVGNQRVELKIPPYTILYHVIDSVVLPVPEQYAELTTMTNAFPQICFKATPGIKDLTTMKTELDTSFVLSFGTIAVRFHTVVSYRSYSSAPSSDLLTNRILRQAFAGSEQAEYLSCLEELREDNVFSSTVAIAFNNLPGASGSESLDQKNKLTKGTM